MDLIFITNQPDVAQVAQSAGVDRVMVDLEIMGKDARQGHLNTVISRHAVTDIDALRPHLDASELLVRINPLHDGSRAEIDDVIARGADRVMLPMFRHSDEAARFVDLVAGRACVSLLAETATAMVRMAEIAAVPGVDDIHIGLNDMHLELKLDFMFEIFAHGLMDRMAADLRAAGRVFGIGGVGPVGAGLMLPAELILAQHARLGSGQVILSRDFGAVLQDPGGDAIFASNVKDLRAYLEGRRAADPADLDAQTTDLRRIVADIVTRKREANHAV